MRRLATVAAIAATPKIHLWRSPIPYLFGGLALTMLLIAGALVVLACSYRKRDPNSSHGGDKEPAAVAVNLQLPAEPKILVIMAGDDTPTYLATPATTAMTKAADVPLCCSCSDDRQGDRNSSP